MSTQDQHLEPHHEFSESIITTDRKRQDSVTQFGDMTSSYHLPVALDPSSAKGNENHTHTVVPLRPAVPGPTKMLHEGDDGKPAITLTPYKPTLPSFERFTPAGMDGGWSFSRDDYSDESAGRNGRKGEFRLFAGNRAHGKTERPELVQLRRDLDEHWVGLKREFEGKTGCKWVPLRGWGAEEWNWSGEDDVGIDGDQEGGFDWLGEGVEI